MDLPQALFFCGVRAAYIRFLWEAQIVQVRTQPPWFVWASGKESPLYVDHRRLLGHPFWRRWAVQALMERVAREGRFQAVVGVATGGIPWAAWIGESWEVPVGYVRSTPKGHGLGRQVEGIPSGVGPVLLVEDLLSTGGSVEKAAAALRREGWPVGAIAVLWSYDAPGQLPLAYPLYSLLTFPEALFFWEREGYLSPEAAFFLRRWHRAGLVLYL